MQDSNDHISGMQFPEINSHQFDVMPDIEKIKVYIQLSEIQDSFEINSVFILNKLLTSLQPQDIKRLFKDCGKDLIKRLIMPLTDQDKMAQLFPIQVNEDRQNDQTYYLRNITLLLLAFQNELPCTDFDDPVLFQLLCRQNEYLEAQVKQSSPDFSAQIGSCRGEIIAEYQRSKAASKNGFCPDFVRNQHGIVNHLKQINDLTNFTQNHDHKLKYFRSQIIWISRSSFERAIFLPYHLVNICYIIGLLPSICMIFFGSIGLLLGSSIGLSLSILALGISLTTLLLKSRELICSFLEYLNPLTSAMVKLCDMFPRNGIFEYEEPALLVPASNVTSIALDVNRQLNNIDELLQCLASYTHSDCLKIDGLSHETKIKWVAKMIDTHHWSHPKILLDLVLTTISSSEDRNAFFAACEKKTIRKFLTVFQNPTDTDCFNNVSNPAEAFQLLAELGMSAREAERVIDTDKKEYRTGLYNILIKKFLMLDNRSASENAIHEALKQHYEHEAGQKDESDCWLVLDLLSLINQRHLSPENDQASINEALLKQTAYFDHHQTKKYHSLRIFNLLRLFLPEYSYARLHTYL